jgi:hypothetical protein
MSAVVPACSGRAVRPARAGEDTGLTAQCRQSAIDVHGSLCPPTQGLSEGPAAVTGCAAPPGSPHLGAQRAPAR